METVEPQTDSAGQRAVILCRTASELRRETSAGKVEILAAPRDPAESVIVVALEIAVAPAIAAVLATAGAQEIVVALVIVEVWAIAVARRIAAAPA